MKSILRTILLTALLPLGLQAQAQEEPPNQPAPEGEDSEKVYITPEPPADDLQATAALPEDRAKWLRLQLFLDREGFNPGKLDAYWGTFTSEALTAWLEAQGREVLINNNWPQQEPEKLLEMADLSSIEQLYTTYAIQEDDAEMIGTLAGEPEKIADQPAMPYTSLKEMVAEMFHADPEFLAELNPGKDLNALKPGDKLKVPNVATVFDLQEINAEFDQERQAESQSEGEENQGSQQSAQNGGEEKQVSEQVKAMKDEVPNAQPLDDPRIVVNKTSKTLTLYNGDKAVAFAPITPGAEGNPAPTGDWELVGVAWMPTFRYDEDMLEEGKRSEDYHIYPPGPNNPVGVIWMSINSKGIGLHGTAAPDSIGRSASHGCVRMSNWDAWSIGRQVKPGIPVKIVE
jgi:lipoprotein-anchoring transpeptidase ErfK/SrfK